MNRENKINIMFLIGNFRLSGAFKVAWEIAIRLPKSHFNVIIVSLMKLNSGNARKNQAIAEANGIKTFSLDVINRGRILTVLDLVNILRKYKIHIIHTHTESCDTHGRIAALLAGTSIRVVTVHNMAPHIGKENIGFIIDKILAPFTSKFIAVSHSIEKFTRNRLNIAMPKIATIYNGIDLNQFANIKLNSNTRPMNGNSPDKYNIGCVGLIYHLKGQINLLKAVQILEKQRSDFQVIIYGEGPEKKLMENEIKKANISSIKIYGWCESKTEIYSSIDILVIPSFIEGLPIVMLEAFASGIPVIATNVGAISDFIINNETGILVPLGDPTALSIAIAKLIDNKNLYYKISEKAKKLVHKLCSVESMVMGYQKIYDQLYNDYIEEIKIQKVE